jgi:hypothetical protein
MASVTAEKPKRATRATAETILAKRRQEQVEIVIAAYAILDEIEQLSGTLTPAEIRVDQAEWCLLWAAGFRERTKVELARQLAKARAVRELREKFGSVATIDAAKEKLRETELALETYQAELADIDVGSSDRPLAKQITQLQDRLKELETRRDSEAAALARLEGDYSTLQDRCPRPLKDAIKLRKDALHRSAECVRLDALDGRIKTLERLLDPDNSHGFRTASRERESWWRNYLAINCPEAVENPHNELKWKVNREKFNAYVASLENVELPALRAEQVELTAKCEALKETLASDVRELMEPWITTGELDPGLFTVAAAE